MMKKRSSEHQLPQLDIGKHCTALEKCSFSKLKLTTSIGIFEQLSTLKWSFDQVPECPDKKSLSSDLFQQTIKVGGKRDRLLVLIFQKIKCCFCFREGVKILMEWLDLTCNRFYVNNFPLENQSEDFAFLIELEWNFNKFYCTFH